jgi:hypothetical protein
MVLPCSYAASQEEKDDLRDSRAGQHPQVPGQEGKKQQTQQRQQAGQKKPQSARRPGGTPNSEKRKLEKFRERSKKKERWKSRIREEFMKN